MQEAPPLESEMGKGGACPASSICGRGALVILQVGRRRSYGAKCPLTTHFVASILLSRWGVVSSVGGLQLMEAGRHTLPPAPLPEGTCFRAVT